MLNPLAVVDAHIMDDADLAGPIVFYFVFAMLLLLVRSSASPFHRAVERETDALESG